MPETQNRETGQPTAAFILSLLAGLWMLAMGVATSQLGMMAGYGMMGGAAPGRNGGSGVAGGMAGGRFGGYGMYGGMHGWMWGRGLYGFQPAQLWLGVAAGILVIVAAFALYVKPVSRRSWGVVILVASALDFFLGMGGLAAGVLGIVGGVLAITA